MAERNYWKKPLTLAEVLEELERSDDSDSPDTIFILPPNDQILTDEDSGDEDAVNIDNLSAKQLNIIAEVSKKNVGDDKSSATYLDVPDNTSSEEEECAPNLKSNSSKRKKIRNWEKGDVDLLQVDGLLWEGSYPPPLPFGESTLPIEYFKLIFSQEIVDEIAKFTSLYAAQKNVNLNVDAADIQAFIGILIVSGYITPSRRRMFWENRNDSINKMVTETMRRNKFDEIFRHLHVCNNNNLPMNDKYAKIRPLVTRINQSFARYAPIEANLSIDESMIRYYGRHTCKQFIRAKPIRFGYKAWSLATKLGYCLQFDLYQGRDPDQTRSRIFGLGESVILKFADFVELSYPDLKFSYFFDNFFTSTKLLDVLTKRGIAGTGTVRENRTDKCPIVSTKEMKRKERGSIDSCIDKENSITAVKWMDNSVVMMLSNKYGVEPLKKALRYSVKQKKKVKIPQPNCIYFYNKYMGGVDQMDNLVSRYPISFRGKKWYIPLIFWIIDVTLNNAWLLSRQYGCKLDKLEFIRQIASDLCVAYGKTKQKPGPSRIGRVSQTQKSSGQHLIVTGTRKTCALCRNRTITYNVR